MRRERHDGVRVGEVESEAVAGQPVEVRRRRGTAVATQDVGAERVNGDQEDVLIELTQGGGERR